MYKNIKVEKLFLFISVIFLIIHHFVGFGGHFGWDDMEYAQLSHQWAAGNFHLTDNHFTYRFPIIFFSGIAYKIFGVNDFASALPAMLISIVILLLVYSILYHRDTRIIITALTITLLSPPFLFYTDKIMSDIYVALGVLISFFALYKYRFDKQNNSLLWALIFVGGVFFAFLTKEVVVLLIPFLLMLFISDIVKKRFLKFWLWAFFFGIGIMVLYHFYLAHKTGNPFSRYLAIEINSYLNPCSYEYLPFINTIKRIGYEFWFELSKNAIMITALFIIPFIFKKRNWNFNKPDSFWVNTSIILLLSANFMTKSYKAYSPMCIDIRHYLFLVPILGITASPFMVRFFYSIKKYWFISISVLVITIWLLFNYTKTGPIEIILFYSLLFLSMFVSKLLKKLNFRTYFWILFLLSWLIIPVFQIVHEHQNGFKNIPRYIEKNFKTLNQKTIILTDPVMKRIADYYMQWDSTKVRFINERDYAIPYRDEAVNYWVFHNGLTWWLADIPQGGPMLTWYLVHPYIKTIDSTAENILYQIEQPEKMNRPVKTYSYSNDMEWNYLPAFGLKNQNYDSTRSYEGRYSYRLDSQGYSPTLFVPLSSICTHRSTKIEIQIKAKIWSENNYKTNIVTSVDDSTGKQIFWLGKTIDKIIKPAPRWQNINMECSYKIKPEFLTQKLKIYLWNNDNSIVWIDNLQIKVIDIEHL